MRLRPFACISLIQVICVGLFLPVLGGCQATARANTSDDVPSDKAVISTIVEAMNHEDGANLAAMTKDLTSAKEDLAAATKEATSKLTECHNAEARCSSVTVQLSSGPHTMGCFDTAYYSASRDECVNILRYYCSEGFSAECNNDNRCKAQMAKAFPQDIQDLALAIDHDRSKIDDNKSKIATGQQAIADFTYRTNQFDFTVAKPAVNYEGNRIAYVNVRKKGTDDVKQYKVVYRLQDNHWVVVDSEPVTQ
jgi:hypothetical protein